MNEAAPTTPVQQVDAAADGTRRKTVADFASPLHFHAHLHMQSIAAFDTVVAAAVQNAKQAAERMFSNYMNWARGVVDAQGKELAFFRTLEHHIKNNTLTDENISDILNGLEAHRKAVLEAGKAAGQGEQA